MRPRIVPIQTDDYGVPFDLRWVDREGITHWTLFKCRGGGFGWSKWTSDQVTNPYCGCHLAWSCRICENCCQCDQCYCREA